MNTVSETLQDILKHLVSSASPSVVLSTRPADVKEVQVHRVEGCERVVTSPGNVVQLAGEYVCVYDVPAAHCNSKIAWCLLVDNGCGLIGSLSSMHRVPRPSGLEGRGGWSPQHCLTLYCLRVKT